MAEGRPIVHAVTRLVLGGPSRPVLAVLERLARRPGGALLLAGRPGPHERPVAAGAVPLLEVPHLARDPAPLADARALVALAAALRRSGPAVVHTHTAKAGALGRAAARLAARRAAVVHTFHGHSLDAAVSGRRAPAWRAIERALARATDALVALSPAQRDDLARRLGPAAARRWVVQPLAFDPAGYPAAAPGAGAGLRALRPGAGGRVLLFVGRGVAVKALDRLAAACARLEAAAPGAAARLAVAVVGPVEPGVEARGRAALGGTRAPRWTFWGPEPNPLPFVAAADAVVLPSLSEGTPVALLEALHAGRPVLASAVGGVPELLAADWERRAAGDWATRPAAPRGLLLPAGDVEAWTAALARFAAEGSSSVPGDPDERRRFVETVFDPDLAAADTLALYGGFTDRRAPRARP